MVYLAARFLGDANRALLELIAQVIEDAGFETFLYVRDVEHWTSFEGDPLKAVTESFALIRRSVAVVAEFSDQGHGVAAECGFAAALGIPVILLSRTNADISQNVMATAALSGGRVVRYGEPSAAMAEVIAALEAVRSS